MPAPAGDAPKITARIVTAARRSGSREAAGLPGAAAELRAVDDAGVLIAGSAELDGADHRALRNAALKPIGHVARLVARAKAGAHGIAVERAFDWSLEDRRALAALEQASLLLERQAMSAVAVQEIELQLPVARDRDGRQPLARRLVGQRGPQHRDNRVTDLHRFARLKLERIDGDRAFGDAVVVEHDAGLAVEHAVAQV